MSHYYSLTCNSSPIIYWHILFLFIPVFPNKWPSGDYGLPKPTSGCPDENWREGFRYQDSENVQNTNLESNGSHFSGRVSQHGVRQEFCMHHDIPAGELIPWPRGKYCIYKKGGKCPLGLNEGTLKNGTFSIPAGTVFNLILLAIFSNLKLLNCTHSNTSKKVIG